MLTAGELHRRGLEASNAGRHGRARGLLNRALDRCDDPETAARILLSLAHVESELGDRHVGLELCERALAIPELPSGLVGLAQSQRGLLLMRAGLGDDALRAFADALGLLNDDPEPRLRVHLNRGNVYLQRGNPTRALKDFTLAASYAQQASLPVQQAKAEHNVGFAHLLTGDLVSALQMMDRARPILSELSLVSEAVCEQDRAEVLAASGMTTDAERALRAAAAAFGARGLRQQQAEAEFILARLLLLDAPLEAAKVARKAGRRFARRGSEGWSLRADAVAVGAQVQARSRSAHLVERADELVDALRQHGLNTEASSLSLQCAQALSRRGDLVGARAHVVGARVTEHAPLAHRLLAREVRAQLAQSQGRRSDAVRHVRKGLADLHEWQSSFGSLDLQSSLVGHGRGLALQGLGLAIEDGRPEVVFEWAERARALASRVSPVRPPSDAEAAADLAELRQVQIEIRDAEVAGAVPEALTRNAAKLSARIRQRAWYDEGSGLVTEPYGLEEVAAELAAADGALVAYLIVDDHIHALVVAGDHVEVRALGGFSDVRVLLDGMRADLDMAAARMPAVMKSRIEASLVQRLDRLAGVLVAPLVDLLGDRPLAVIPSGSLAGVPWSLLPALYGRPLTVPRSASSWLQARASAQVAEAAGFVAGPRVARAADEVGLASKAWRNSVVLLGKDAHASAVRDLASTVDVFHVAAHGRHSAENPLFSGLELVDGPWFGYDIDRLDRIPSTVILSACELGRSSVRWGEETIGMSVAWLHAGARTVIASPASVNDDAACALLAATHTRLAAGISPSMALAEAAADVDTDSPAPFLCFGNGW